MITNQTSNSSNFFDTDDFLVNNVAIHLVDRILPSPKLADSEINLSDFTSPEDHTVVKTFFNRHLKTIIQSEEKNKVRSASFTRDSEMQRYYQEIMDDPTRFFQHSCNMAVHLHEVSKGKATSTGVLMVIRFSQKSDGSQFITLMKMDHKRNDVITLKHDSSGSVLLDLAVQYITESLPSPDEQVLKWAIIPNPMYPAYDALVKDEQGKTDPAAYFMNFLGCETKPTERNQVRSTIDAVKEYVSQEHPHENVEDITSKTLIGLQQIQSPQVDKEAIADVINNIGEIGTINEHVFYGRLREKGVENINLSTKTLQKMQIEYQLPNGITIKGPIEAILSSLTEISTDGGIEYRLRTPHHVEPKYVIR